MSQKEQPSEQQNAPQSAQAGASSTESDSKDIKRWTTKRRSALVLEIVRGETTAAEAARKHGLTVAEVEDSCGVQSISAVISNTANGRAPVVLRREGIVSCFLLVEPRPAVPAVIQGDTTATSAERTLANLHCRLYGPEAGGFTAHVRRLDLAFSELKRRVDVVDD